MAHRAGQPIRLAILALHRLNLAHGPRRDRPDGLSPAGLFSLLVVGSHELAPAPGCPGSGTGHVRSSSNVVMSAVAISRIAIGAAVSVMCLLPVAGCDRPIPPVPRETATLVALPQLVEKQAVGLASLPWQAASSVPAHAQILISVPDAQCYQVVGSRVRSSATAVTITIWGRPTTCRSVSDNVMAVVQLPHPLGTRSVAHAPVTAASATSTGR
jgi:hypothetical protein